MKSRVCRELHPTHLLAQPHSVCCSSHVLSVVLMPAAFERGSSLQTPAYVPCPLRATPWEGRAGRGVTDATFRIYCVCVLYFALSSDSL